MGKHIIFSSSDLSDSTEFKYRISDVKESRLMLSAMKHNPSIAWRLLSQKIGGLIGLQSAILIHAYPVPVNGSFGATIITYADPEQTIKALRFSEQSHTFTILTGMPLLLAEALLRSTALPKRMLMITGGYPMPFSLEKFLVDYCSQMECQLDVMHAYGVAEIDAGLFFAFERNKNGELIYYPRDDIEYSISDSGSLSVRVKLDGKWSKQEQTGDFAERHDDGILIKNPQRLSKKVELALAEADWKRKTGYVALDETGALRWQLRRDTGVQASCEMEHFDFMRSFGMRWISKPNWSL